VTFFALNSCFDDNLLEIMKDENNYYLKQHSVYFKISKTGQTESYTDTPGEDSDYSSSATGIPDQSFTDNNNGTITDNISKLVWTKCSMSSDKSIDQDKDECTKSHEKYDWHSAVEACEKLNYAEKKDWRLPTVHELNSIVHFGKTGRESPAIDENYFPNTGFLDCMPPDETPVSVLTVGFFSSWSDSKYWTSTLWTSFGYAIAIHFDDGYQNSSPLENHYFVRCVAGPGEQD